MSSRSCVKMSLAAVAERVASTCERFCFGVLRFLPSQYYEMSLKEVVIAMQGYNNHFEQQEQTEWEESKENITLIDEE